MKYLQKYRLLRLGLPLSLGFVALTGCTQETDEGGENQTPVTQTITHTEAQALIQETIQANSAALEERLRFLDGDTRLIQAFNEFFSADEDSCYFTFDEEGNEEEICESFDDSEEGEEALRIDFMEGTEELISNILAELGEDALVAETAQLTYQINPNEFCDSIGSGEDDSEAPILPEENPDAVEDNSNAECTSLMERETPRVQLVGIQDGISATLFVAQGREELVKADLTNSLARVSLDLGVLTRIVNEIDENNVATEGGERSFNLNVTGAISLEMDTRVAGQATFRFNVDRAITVSGQFDEINSINLNFPAANNVFSVTSDNTMNSLALRFDVPKLVESFSASLNDRYEYDEETGEEILVEDGPIRNIVATLGGFDFGFVLRLVGEGVESTLEVGLGDESTVIQADGQEILRVDLNPDHGRLISFNLNRSDFENEDMVLALASELHQLKVQVNLEVLPEIEPKDWLVDEVFKLVLTSAGGELPSVMFESAQEQLKLLAGHFELSAERAGIEHVMEGGQCMMSNSNDDSFQEPPIDEPIDESISHPFEEMEVGMCR